MKFHIHGKLFHNADSSNVIKLYLLLYDVHFNKKKWKF